MKILGISALYHDSAATLVSDNKIIAAVQEERFTRKKHDLSIPSNAIRYCLSEAQISSNELDAVVYYDNPILSLDRWLKNCVALGRDSTQIIEKNFDSIFAKKLWIHKLIEKSAGSLGKHGKLLACEHHLSHASSAFYPSSFEQAAIITIDGVGEWATTTIGIGNKNNIEIIKQIHYPHSLGLLYSAFTYFCGFKVNSGEYKLMGLAPYGKPKYYQLIKEKIIDIKDDGSFRLNLDYFQYQKATVMTDDFFGGLFNSPKRQPESKITKREMDIAASIQKITEEVVIKMAKFTRTFTAQKNLCLAGGVALNCVANGKLFAEHIFENIWTQPAAGDAGGSLGAALYANHMFFQQKRITSTRDSQMGSFLGPSFEKKAIQKYLNKNGAKHTIIDNDKELSLKIAKMIADGKVVGLFSGRMEFGPRALGARSILGNPMLPDMQQKLNLKIKFRESFRPFAPSVLKDKVNDYFDFKGESPYMILTAPIKTKIRKEIDLSKYINNERPDNLLPVINKIRSTIPAVTHVDYSARLQTVNKFDHPLYYDIISQFEKLTGCAVLINTSFNVRGEPIVCTPKDAYTCFMRTNMDVLILENIILFKEEQPQLKNNESWRQKYELD